MEEKDYAELFGVEADEKDPEPVEPGTEPQGENEQEAAEPATEETGNNLSAPDGEPYPDDGEGTDEKAPEEAEKPGQSAEENAAFAAARRKAEAERDAAIAREKEQAKAEIDTIIGEIFADNGIVNPYSGLPVKNREEYEAYKKQRDAERQERVKAELGMSDEEYRRYLDTLPEVAAAKEAQAEAERIQREAREREAKRNIADQLREIGQLDPSIKSLDDLIAMDNYPEFYERVQRGMTLSEAFRLTNYQRLTQAAAEASRQAALNAAASKNHLKVTDQKGKGAASVPADVRDMYRMLNPDATDAEIQAHYNKSHKK